VASLTELEQWDEELYQLETTDPVVGGPNGISNQQAKTLGNRTKYLKALILNAIGNDEDFATTISNALSQKVAITDLQEGTHVTAVDTGAANAYVVALSPAVAVLTNGIEISFTPENTNTGPSTIVVNGLAAVPIVGGALSALQGGEIIASGRVKLKYNSTIASFVIIATTGAIQVSDANKSKHAVSLGQFDASKAANGYQKLPSGLIIQWGTTTISLAVSQNSAEGNTSITFPVTFPSVAISLQASVLTDVINGTCETCRPTALTTSGVTLRGMSISSNSSGSPTAGTVSVYWVALGY